jgi:tetratricopeptide (TPR) repeat protein
VSATAVRPPLEWDEPEPASRRAGPDIAGVALTFGLAAVLVAAALEAQGGLKLAQLTTVITALCLLGGVTCALALLAAGATRRPWGAVSLALLALLAVLTGLSTTWAIAPDAAWIETNRTLTWLLVFASGIALVRLSPDRWRSVLFAVLLASVAVSAYALLTKILPAELAEDETYARLREPYGYWNAVGLSAAIGLPIALWLGARREGHGVTAALAHPAIGVLVLTMLLAYSRGALVAAVLGVGFWLAFVPLRLRGAAVLIPGALLGGLAAAWAFGQSGLSDDDAVIDLRTDAGTELGVLLVFLVLALLVIGLVMTFLRDRRTWPEPTRRAWGAALLVALALVPFALAGALALSERGLGGSVSKAWRDLTDPEASTPKNDPGRLTAIGSVRARYWRDAIDIFEARTLRGVGAGGYHQARLRFRDDDLDVLHAHGYLVQTAADLGILGLAVSLALLAAWLAAAYRSTAPWRRPGARDGAERTALLTMTAVVVAFAVHSLIDWTWFIPGTIVPALLLAGWVAGRGPDPQEAAPPLRERLRGGIRNPARVIAAVAVLVLALTAVWSAQRPQRALDKVDDALAALADRRPDDARQLAVDAGDMNPLSLEPLFALAEIEGAAGRPDGSRAAYEQAVQLQPASADAWVRLANFELVSGRPQQALTSVRPALYLDPRSRAARAVYLEAYRQSQPQPEPRRRSGRRG